MHRPALIEHVKKLWLLSLVVESGSFRQAATRAKLTQSAVSQAVALLERQLGRVLLVRRSGRAVPTPLCLAIVEKTKLIISMLDELALSGKSLESASVPSMTWLDFGANESLSMCVLPRLIERLRRHLPDLRIATKVASSVRLAAMVRKGELCMAIIPEISCLSRLTVIPLVDERLGFYIAANAPAAALGWNALEVLGLGTIDAASEGDPGYHRNLLRRACGMRKPAFSSDSWEALLGAAVHGQVVALLPARLAARASKALLELTPPLPECRILGNHRLVLISQSNCDDAENEYLASELRSLLGDQGDELTAPLVAREPAARRAFREKDPLRQLCHSLSNGQAGTPTQSRDHGQLQQ